MVAPDRPGVLVVQDGARRHYAIPRMLHERGMLERMVTDFFFARGTRTRRLARCLRPLLPGMAREMVGRSCEGLPGERVADFPWRGAWSRLLRKADPARFAELRHFVQHQAQVVRSLPGEAQAMYVFIPCAHPPLLDWARERGLAVVGDQIMAPRRFLRDVLAAAERRFPAWRSDGGESPAWIGFVDEVEQAMWSRCDRVVAGSGFVREKLLERGLEPEKAVTVEPPLDGRAFPFVDRSGRGRDRPITVGFVGQVGLRKGVPYLLEAAMKLPTDRYRFELVGPVTVDEAAVTPYRDRVNFRGRVPRWQMHEVLAGFDLLAFPSLCEGAATAVNEAMATGLPVVCTPSAGSRLVDGEHGRLVEVGDVEALAGAIEEIGEDRDKRLSMGRRAHEMVADYTAEDYADRLVAVVRDAVAAAGASPVAAGQR